MTAAPEPDTAALAVGPFTGLGRCTFCGTKDVYVYPAPRAEQIERGYDPKFCAEELPCACAPCCGLQEDGHDFEYERDERGYRCTRCGDEPPHDWYGYDFD